MKQVRWSALLSLLLILTLPAWAQDKGGGVGISQTLEDLVKTVTLTAARFVEGAAALVIAIAAVRAIFTYLWGLLRQDGDVIPKDSIRLSLGRSLALALEFTLGADILLTAVAPTWPDIGKLASIAVLRTALNYFLERELRNAEARDPQAVAKEEPS